MRRNRLAWYSSLLIFSFVDLTHIQFVGLLSASILYDLVWMFNNEQAVFLRLLTVVLFLLKVSKSNIIATGRVDCSSSYQPLVPFCLL